MPKLNWLDTLFLGVRRVLAAGVELPERPALNFVGVSVTVTGRLKLREFGRAAIKGSEDNRPRG